VGTGILSQSSNETDRLDANILEVFDCMATGNSSHTRNSQRISNFLPLECLVYFLLAHFFQLLQWNIDRILQMNDFIKIGRPHIENLLVLFNCAQEGSPGKLLDFWRHCITAKSVLRVVIFLHNHCVSATPDAFWLFLTQGHFLKLAFPAIKGEKLALEGRLTVDDEFQCLGG
jgi:hypothetical protein